MIKLIPYDEALEILLSKDWPPGQAEVAYWMYCGKFRDEIAQIMNIKRHTVDSVVERICIKHNIGARIIPGMIGEILGRNIRKEPAQ